MFETEGIEVLDLSCGGLFLLNTFEVTNPLSRTLNFKSPSNFLNLHLQ